MSKKEYGFDVVVMSKTELIDIIKSSRAEALQNFSLPTQDEDFLTITEAAEWMNLSKQTLYQKTSKNEIPYLKKGKRIYFQKSELKIWLESGRIRTQAEIQAEAR